MIVAGRVSAMWSSTGCAVTETVDVELGDRFADPRQIAAAIADETGQHAGAGAGSHPSHEIPKTYLATVAGTVPRGLGKKLRAGIELEDGPARVDDFAVVDAIPGKTLVRLTIHEGRNRIVRRLLAAAGFRVEALVRTDIGAVSLGKQRPGSIRALGRDEIVTRP